jgi:hypothetical protein
MLLQRDSRRTRWSKATPTVSFVFRYMSRPTVGRKRETVIIRYDDNKIRLWHGCSSRVKRADYQKEELYSNPVALHHINAGWFKRNPSRQRSTASHSRAAAGDITWLESR